MKKQFISLTLVFFLIFPFIYSFSYLSTDTYEIFEDNEARLNDDILFFGDKITIEHDVTGNIIGLSQKAIFNKDIYGNLYSASSTIIINGNVEGDVFFAAQYVFINGNISGNAKIYSQELSIGAEGSIAGKTTIYSGETTIFGSISDADISTKDFRLYGSSDDIFIDSEILYLDSKSLIKGDLNYTAEVASKKGNVLGEENFIAVKKKGNFSSLVYSFLFSYVSFLLVGIVLIILPWSNPKSKVKVIRHHFIKATFYGILFFICTPIILILLAATVVGIPIAILCLGLFLALLYTSKVYLCIYLGSFVGRNIIIQFIVGLFLYSLITLIPYIGLMFSFISIFVSLGAIVMSFDPIKFMKKL